jgi:hypothetical protein
MDETLIPLDALHHEIAGCTRCPARLVEHGWLPVGYFGAFRQATAWVISINPSHREFVARDGRLLRGAAQRFAALADDPACADRPAFAARHLATILARQDEYYARNPYPAFFNKLGAFLLQVHGMPDEPLRPFRTPLPDGTFYCHMDIAKCATRSVWTTLAPAERALVRRNCRPYLAHQLALAPQVRRVLVNGRSALASVSETFAELGFHAADEILPFGRGTVTLRAWHAGSYPAVRFLGWSANVVNGHLTAAEKALLAALVRERLGDEG